MNDAGSWPSALRQAVALGGWLLLSFAPGATGVFVDTGSWYAQLQKPSWNPPAWVFGPVWTCLYLSMGFAAWLVWRRGGWRTQRLSLSLFLVQLLLNALWTPLFFGWHRPDWAFFEILLLLAAISAVFLLFFRCSRLAALLLAPYLAWTAFAAVLTFTIWRMNT